MYIGRKEYYDLLKTIENLNLRQEEIIDTVGYIFEEIFRENNERYDKLNKELVDMKDLLAGKGKTQPQNSSSEFEQNINKELCEIKSKLESLKTTSNSCAYNGGTPIDDIIYAVKDYYDSKECY